ncbi:farnesyl-diphosphate farnesyltransferase [Dongia mobilis]|uniref:Farnesyl-diphosphate farnesyltransferase n=1 Tax=Dongia mobilis TaxID=578943 RepID=A0A4V3DDR6_9PROT|nr:presqualene diphosphate synthase HpnD [Dongia mobilis]TDQ77732.1 farnesyl-diphosphate farnesyltransferase [Dongia mobilis]
MSAQTAAIAEKVRASGTSFYAAMRLLPEARRAAMFAIYAFCREVDDIADEEAPQADKQAGLAEWRREIDRLYAGKPENPIAQALLQPMRDFALRREDFLAVIDGMEMDATAAIQAPDMATLDLYCDRVASAVGRLSVRAFGATEAAADDVAYHLGRALQLTNILRDVAEDASRDRLYLPRDLLVKHGIASTEPSEVLKHANLAAVCRDLSLVAQDHFAKADAAMRRCAKEPMRPARIMGAVYGAILEKLIAWDWRDFTTPIKVPKWRKLWLALRYGFF